MYDWYDKACEELDEDLNNGDITFEEYCQFIRELNEELRESGGA